VLIGLPDRYPRCADFIAPMIWEMTSVGREKINTLTIYIQVHVSTRNIRMVIHFNFVHSWLTSLKIAPNRQPDRYGSLAPKAPLIKSTTVFPSPT